MSDNDLPLDAFSMVNEANEIREIHLHHPENVSRYTLDLSVLLIPMGNFPNQPADYPIPSDQLNALEQDLFILPSRNLTVERETECITSISVAITLVVMGEREVTIVDVIAKVDGDQESMAGNRSEASAEGDSEDDGENIANNYNVQAITAMNSSHTIISQKFIIVPKVPEERPDEN